MENKNILIGSDHAGYELKLKVIEHLRELGYTPIAPHLMFPQFMDDDIPSERKDAMDMAKDILRRCRVLVVCGKELSDGMMQEIALAKHLGIVQTSLDGIEKVDECVQSESDDED